ncbi:DNA-processing protein DprA [Castellaniella sp.]|jgi:DNA processing protein|uniref:DNA-processing protein DprA n=1 Tax=Castellaniella sp. TaxID=1955812 RepID=UPI002D801D88|nr:DNA-processing protein DprA [Castellaniella sp.]HET8702938.1 DNA-processing protein DprA [Castellaniella sp.]
MPLNASETELRAWIRLSLEPELGAARIRLLLSVFGMPQDIVAATTGSLARYLDPAMAARLRQPPGPELQSAIDRTLEWLQAADHHLLTLADPHYPRALYALADPPPLLYAHGRLDILTRPMLAIVGARHATVDGERNAHAFARHLALKGWCVVSGLASGIDGAAHAGALDAGEAGGSTLAVLGTGIDRVYPPAHHTLAHRIATHGLLLSEFPLGTPGLPYHFPQRNRLVAALGQGVLVVEAAARSGSLTTARLAGELGREVFAIPGSIHSPLSRGCHALIRQGAKLVESGQDIIEELRQGALPGLRTPPAPDAEKDIAAADAAPGSAPEASAGTAGEPGADTSPGIGPDARALLGRIGRDPVGLDTLQADLDWPIDRLMSQLTLLEVAGRIDRTGNGRYRRRSEPPAAL